VIGGVAFETIAVAVPLDDPQVAVVAVNASVVAAVHSKKSINTPES